MKRQLNWAMAPIFGMLLFTLGCIEIDPAEAQKALAVGQQIRDLQSEEVRPLMTSLDQLRADEMEPLYFEMEQLARKQETLYRERIQPLERQLRDVYPDDRSFSIQQDEFDAQMREIQQLERQLEAESWQLDRMRRQQELELRVGFEDTMRIKQDVIEELRQQLYELYRTGQRTLDELYRQQSELYSGYSWDYQDSDEAMFLRDELAQIEWQIANSQAGVDGQASALQQEITTLEWESQQFSQTLSDLERQRNTTLDQLEELYREMEVSFSGGTDSGSLEQRVAEVRARLSELDINDPEVMALATELMELEIRLAEGTDTIELQMATVKQEILSLEEELPRIYAVVDELEMLLVSKKETLQALYNQLDELRLSVSTTTGGTIEGDTIVQTTVIGNETEIIFLEAEIAALEGEIATLTAEFDVHWATEQSMVARLDALYNEMIHLTDSMMDEESLYRWMDEITARLNNLLIQHSAEIQTLNDELAAIESQIVELEASFQDQVLSVEKEITVLEGEIALLQPVSDEVEVALHAVNEELGALYQQMESLHVAGAGLAETYARIEEIEVLLAASYPDSDIWAPLDGELSFLGAVAAEGEATFQNQVSTLEQQIVVLEAEVANLQQEFEVQVVELNAQYDRLDGLYHQLNEIYNGNGDLEHLYSRREQIYVELSGTSAVGGFAGPDYTGPTSYGGPDYIAELERGIAALEEQMHWINNDIQQQESALHSNQSRLGELYEKLDGMYRTGGDVEHLYKRIEEINARLAELSNGTTASGSYEQALAAIDEEIVQTDARFREQTRALEDRIADLEMAMYAGQRDMEDRMTYLNRDMEWGMLELDDRRFELQERRWVLEDRMWGRMDGVKTDMDSARWAIEDKMERIYADEIRPIEDRMYQIETKLQELQQRERSLGRELLVVERQFAPMEREMEDIAFTIFEDIVTQFAQVDGTDVEVETVPVTTDETVPATTDETNSATATE